MDPIPTVESIASVLPNIGVGVAAIMAVVYHSILCKKSQTEFLMEMKEQNHAFRKLEQEVRNNIMSQLSENTRAMERMNDHVNNGHRRSE